MRSKPSSQSSHNRCGVAKKSVVSSVAKECRVFLWPVLETAEVPSWCCLTGYIPARRRQQPFGRVSFGRQKSPTQNYKRANSHRPRTRIANPDSASKAQHCEASAGRSRWKSLLVAVCFRVVIDIIQGRTQNVGIHQRWESRGKSSLETHSGRTQ